MARHFEKLIADIDKVLTAEFKYDQDDDEAEPRLDLDLSRLAPWLALNCRFYRKISMVTLDLLNYG